MMKEEIAEVSVFPSTGDESDGPEAKPNTPGKKYSVKFKRNRSSRACEVCHSRKVRCDATIHIPCTNCLTFGCECKFPERKERKNAKKRKEGDDQNSGANSTVTASSALAAAAVKRKIEPLAAISARSAKIDTQNLFKRSANSISFIGSAATASLLTDVQKSDSNSSHLSMDDWVPPSLKESISKTRVSFDTVQMEILRLRGAFHLPEKPLCDDLINTYFEHIYPVEPIIDREDFMKQYEDGSLSLLLLQSVLLAASRISTNDALFDSNDSNYLASCTFYQRAKALFDTNYENDPISVVQSLVLFTRFWEGTDDILGNSFYWVRVATGVAQGYGFHRNMQGTVLSRQKIRLCQILWWQLYIKDISSSVGFGRPKMIQLEDCDVPMLKVEDLPSDLSKEDAEAFIQMVRLSEIISIVLQEQYSIRAEKTRQRDNLAITHCDMIMSSWRNSLPSSLQYSTLHHHNLSINILNMYYYSAVCLVHRSNMVKVASLNGKQYPSEGIVFRASKIIADIASKLLKSGDIKYCHALIIPALFSASTTFLCHMDSKNTAISKSARIGYDICFQSLKKMGENYLISTLIHHLIDKFAKDPKSREKLVIMLARKNESIPPTSIATSAATSAHVEAPDQVVLEPVLAPQQQQQQVPLAPQFQQQSDRPDSLHQPSPNASSRQSQFFISQSQTPRTTGHVSQIQTPMAQVPSGTLGFHHHTQPPAVSEQGALELPDLYLFTNTLPSSMSNEFDPSQLFPINQQRDQKSEDGASVGFNPNEFNLNLPEFDFQPFSNSISIQNLASLNNYIDQPNPNTSQIQQQVPVQAPQQQQVQSQNGNTPRSAIYNFGNN